MKSLGLAWWRDQVFYIYDQYWKFECSADGEKDPTNRKLQL
jgi:hypothetical protein